MSSKCNDVASITADWDTKSAISSPVFFGKVFRSIRVVRTDYAVCCNPIRLIEIPKKQWVPADICYLRLCSRQHFPNHLQDPILHGHVCHLLIEKASFNMSAFCSPKGCSLSSRGSLECVSHSSVFLAEESGTAWLYWKDVMNMLCR